MITDTVLGTLLAAELPPPTAPPGGPKFEMIIGWIMWGLTIAGVLSIAVIGIKFAYEKWAGDSMDSPKRLLGAVVGAVIFALAAPIWNTLTG